MTLSLTYKRQGELGVMVNCVVLSCITQKVTKNFVMRIWQTIAKIIHYVSVSYYFQILKTVTYPHAVNAVAVVYA